MTDIIKSDELPESLQIKSDKFTNSFQSIQLAMQEFWKEPLHNHYTRHDLEHSQRIINYIGKLLEENKNLLNEQERFVIIAAALLHDIGMQGAKYAGFKKKTNFTIKDLEKIRKVHHLTSAKMIADSITKGSELKLGIENCVDYADFITDISKYHRELDLKELKNKHFEGESVRLPLLASLLRFGDALDQDHRRVNVAQLKYREIPVNSKYYWWSHHFCSSIEIQDGKIRVHFRFPEAKKDDQIVDAFIGSVKSSVQNQLWEVYQALWSYKVKLNVEIEIGDVDYSGSALLDIPKDLLKYLEEKVLKIRKRVEGLKEISGASWEVDGIPYSDNKEVIQHLNNIIKYVSEGKNKEALEEVKKARALTKTPMQTLVFSIEAGNINNTLGSFEEALNYYNDVLNLSTKEDVRNVYGAETLRFKSSALGNIGIVYHTQGKTEDALKYHKQALKLDNKTGFSQGVANQLNSIGLIYKDKGLLSMALRYFNRALKINEQTGNLGGKASCLGNKGLVYLDRNELTKALKYFKQALELNRIISFHAGEENQLGNIGLIYLKKNQLNIALKYFNEAVLTARKIGDQRGESIGLGNIGLVYNIEKKPSKALNYLNKALVKASNIGYQRGMVDHLGNIGITYIEMGQINKAINNVEKVLSISMDIDYKWSIANSHNILSQLYLEAGNKSKFEEHKKSMRK